jgi:CRISPR-associated protein (TIGR03986 family)
MSWPQHQDPSSEDRTARAPYNFVPLPEKVIPAADLRPQDRYYDDRKTGYLECQLTTRSPLFVRCGLTPEEYQAGKESKDAPDFFYTDSDTKAPVIPGSSLRGMLRALVEIIGYGKVQPVSRRRLFYRAVADPMTTLRESYHRQMEHVSAGYVEEQDGTYAICPAKMIGGSTFFKVSEAVLNRGGVAFTSISDPRYQPQYVACWFQPSAKYPDSVGSVSSKSEPDYHKGILVCSGPFGDKKRKHWIVPEADANADPLPIPEETAREYIDTLTEHQKQKPFDKQTGCLVAGNPVFYLADGRTVVDFGPTRFFRVAYRGTGKGAARSARDFVPPALRDPDQTDLAEAMFGYVEPEADKDRKEVALAGRVFVSDARLTVDQTLDEIWLTGSQDAAVTPRILSGPKPTTFAHYLTQVKPDRVRVRGKGGGDRFILDLSHYASPTPGETVIRGHKLYWHKGPVDEEDIAESEEVGPDDTQHTRFKPLRQGVQFGFRIYFENLSQVELGALLWALNLPEPGDYCHKLGMGKPLGMGAVKIESELHLTQRQTRYQTLFDGDGWALGLDVVDVAEEERQALAVFKRAVLDDDSLNPGRAAGTLAKVPRIATLLTMLGWPGPPPEATPYMTVLKEFTQRKVLPSPPAVAGEGADGATGRPHVPEAMAETAPAEPGLEQWQQVEATVTSGWSKGEVRVDLPNGLKGKLKVSKKDAPAKGETLTVAVERQQGAFYLVVLP